MASLSPIVNSGMGLRYLGQILNLKNFQGTVSVSLNNFLDNYIMYGSCGAGQKIHDSIDQQPVYYSVMGQRLYSQMRNLISIIGTDYQIVIAENTFNDNSAVKGLIYIDSNHRTKPLFIYKNTFINNIGYFGTVSIFIRGRTNTGISNIVADTYTPAEATLQCGGYHIDSNYFEHNIACPSVGEAIVEFECVANT